VEKNQYKICVAVLNQLAKKGVLSQLILIGSWCMYFYRDYFNSPDYLPSIRTRDIDFLVAKQFKLRHPVNVPALLGELGFTVDFSIGKGYIRLMHPDLLIDFLVPGKGRGTDKPYPLPQLGLNAQPLRFLDFLTHSLIHLKVEEIEIVLPHPANFALHKLIIFQLRTSPAKQIKDKDEAVKILKALVDKGETEIIKQVFGAVNKSWQQKILQGLSGTGEKELLEMLRG
jgi:hypothetical protein